MKNSARFELLIHHGKKTKDFSTPEELKSAIDDASALPDQVKSAWARFLSSIATTEAVEEIALKPIAKFFESDSAIQDYLEAHAEDERRHHRIFVHYVKATFDYMKIHRSLSDQVIYDRILPFLSEKTADRPVIFLSIIHFYEAFSISFYKDLKECAKAQGLFRLSEIVASVEKDELRHLAGLELLIEELPKRHSGLMDRLWMRAALELVLLDIRTAPWALHNRHIRQNLSYIGLSPSSIDRKATESAQKTLQFISNAFKPD